MNTNPIRKVIATIAPIGFVAGLGVHIAALQQTDLMADMSWLFALQFISMLCFAGVLIVWGIEKRPQTYFQDVVVKRVWPFACILPLMGYAMYNVFTNFQIVGYFEERDGQFLRLNHGDVLEAYPTRAAYEAAIALRELLETTSYSAQWIAFFGIAMVLLLADKTYHSSNTN